MSAEILIADDDPSAVSVLEHLLQSEGYRTRRAETGTQVLEALESRAPDLILLDVSMPDLDGLETTKRIRDNLRTALVPIIIVSGEQDPEVRVRGIEWGADDFVSKPFHAEELKARIARNLDRSAAERSANPLTGLPGSPRIEAELQRRIQNGEKFVLAYVDADFFKAYNDVYGYAQGDEVIQRIADLLQGTVARHPDFEGFAGHIGGDDFALVGSPEGAAAVCREITEEFDKLLPAFYSREDLDRGELETRDRQGKPAHFPLLRLTIGVASNVQREIPHYAKAVQIATELKTYGKSKPGRTASAWFEDKRKD